MGAPKLNAEKKIKISICPFFFFFFLPTGAKIFLFIAPNPGEVYGKLPVGINVSRDQRSREHPLAKFTVTVSPNQPCLSLSVMVFGKLAQVKHRTESSMLPDICNLPSGHTLRWFMVWIPSHCLFLEPGLGLLLICAITAHGLAEPAWPQPPAPQPPVPTHQAGRLRRPCAQTFLLYTLPKKIKHHCPINYVSYGAIFFPESPTGSRIIFPGSLASSLATR